MVENAKKKWENGKIYCYHVSRQKSVSFCLVVDA